MVPPPAASLVWIETGTSFYLDRASRVEVAAPSTLPDWTNGHVLAHIARNAEGIGRLLTWANTGVETPMYESAAARSADIERDAGRPRDIQLADIRATAADLHTALGAVDDAAWSSTLRLISGREITGAEIPWLRVKEVWLHAVDIGADIADLPPDLVDAVLRDVSAFFGARDDTPALRLIAADSGAEYAVHGGGAQVSGPAAALLAWLTGRADGSDLRGSAPLPAIPRWA
jgi:maleylpyruvate isomerase